MLQNDYDFHLQVSIVHSEVVNNIRTTKYLYSIAYLQHDNAKLKYIALNSVF